MNAGQRQRLRQILIGGIFAALVSTLNLPGADKLGLGGSAAAQGTIAVETFYDELAPYGQWVSHPRHQYVWMPTDVDATWRPYAVGRWRNTDEHGWYWDSQEPFGWAVYHYGRWGYEPDYGWYWVPGDTWAPAWVQWRYSDEYVGWAPMAPRRFGYEYGRPVRYDPPIAESWVFVRPRYLTSRAIRYHAVPITNINIVYSRATYVYRPQYRNGHYYNWGMPRDRWSRVTRRHVQPYRLYRGDNRAYYRRDWRNDRRRKEIHVYAPGVHKGVKPRRAPKKFVRVPPKPRAKVQHVVRKDLPRGGGKSVRRVKAHPRPGPSLRANQGIPGKPARAKVNTKEASPKLKADRARAEAAQAARVKAARAKAEKEKAARVNAARGKAAKASAAKAKEDAAKAARARAGKAQAERDKAARVNAARAKAANKAKATNSRKGGPPPAAAMGKPKGQAAKKPKGQAAKKPNCKARPNHPACGGKKRPAQSKRR